MSEMDQDSGHSDVVHYHYGCWYVHLKEQGTQWLDPADTTTDTRPASTPVSIGGGPAGRRGS